MKVKDTIHRNWCTLAYTVSLRPMPSKHQSQKKWLLDTVFIACMKVQ